MKAHQRTYSTHRSIQILSRLLLEHRIKYVVLCPGSRNAPIVQTLASQSEFVCFPVGDERSAAFMALGISSQLNCPVAVCCTSGSALANFMPAVSEAFYRNIPLLILSADRPLALIGQKTGQTMPQTEILDSIVCKKVNLPEVHTTQEEWFCNRLVNDALLALYRKPLAPVHINIPISEPLFTYRYGGLPETRKVCELPIFRKPDLSAIESWWKRAQKRMILLGQTSPGEYDFSLIGSLGDRKDCVFVAEHIGNTRGCAISDFDRILEEVSFKDLPLLAPDLLVTLGGHLVSKRLVKLLKSYPPKVHICVNNTSELIDTYQCLTVNIPCAGDEFLPILTNISEAPSSNYKDFWLESKRKLSSLPDFIYSDLGVLQQIISILPQNAIVHLGNSTVIRMMQLFPLPVSVDVYANRGISGIDGVVSTALGAALVSEEEVFLFIGDLAFFYDMNALWYDPIPPNFTIIMLNNASGGIFHLLPEMKKGAVLDEFVAHRHRTSAKGWVEERGFDYRAIHHSEELKEVVSWLSIPHKKARFVEAFISVEATKKALNQLKLKDNE